MSTPQFQHLDAEAEEGRLRKIAEGLADAMNRCDAVSFAAHFAGDGEFTGSDGTYCRGRLAIQKLHEPMFAPTPTSGVPSFRNALLTIRDSRVRLLRPDVATLDVRWNQIGAVRADGSPWPERRGLFKAVLVKEEGEWRVAASHTMDLP